MRRWPKAAAVRDWILFTVGLAGVVHETVVTEVDRPGLLLLFAAMLGLPYALQADRAQREPPPDPPPGPGADGRPPSPTSPPPQS